MGTKLRVVFAAPGMSWGGLFTPEARDREIMRFKEQLNALKPAFPDVTFIEEELRSRKDVARLDEDRGEDGLLFLNLSGGTDEAIFKALGRGGPMVLFIEPYSWHVWCREALRQHPNADKLLLVSSSRFDDVAAKIRVIQAYNPHSAPMF